MTKASDNAFPSILITEGTEPSAPAAGKQRVYIDSTTHHLMRTNSSGTETDIEAGSSGIPATIFDAAGDIIYATAADTAARLALGNAGGALSRVNGALAWNSNTSFPTAASGDRFWRTDLGEQWYYDGTRWVSTNIYRADMSPGDVGQNGTTAGVMGRGVWEGTGQEIYIINARLFFYVSTTNTGSAYWTGDVRKVDSSNANSSLGTVNTSADAANTVLTKNISINAVLTAATYGYMWDYNVTKTGSPGAVRTTCSIMYRRIAT